MPSIETQLKAIGTSALVLLACASAPAVETAAPAAPPMAQPAPRESVELPATIERARLEQDVSTIAKHRPPKSAHHARVRRLLSERLAELGYTLERHAYGSGENIIGRRAGSATNAEQLIVSAHYDHIPGCAGADDNASGVAAALEIARVLRDVRHARTLVIAFWDEEELGLIGSRAFANRARDRGEKIRVAITLDAIGYASAEAGTQRVPEGFEQALPAQAALLAERKHAGDFVALVANTAATHAVRVFHTHARAVELPTLSLELSLLEWLAFPDVFRSDHASFWQNGYASFLLSDTGDFRNPGYHCSKRGDTPSTLDYAFLERVTEATARTAQELLGR